MKLVILGAGGHAKVVLSLALDLGHQVLGLLDDDAEKWGQNLMGFPVAGPTSRIWELAQRDVEFVLAIGDNGLRQKLAEEYQGVPWATLVHPKAYVHSSVTLGEGTVVMAGAIVQPMAVVGKHVIVNTGAVVEHDCWVGDYAHIAPGAKLGGGVWVGAGALVGIGAVIIPGRSVGDKAVLGGGSVVVRNIPSGAVAYGVPARVVRQEELS